MNRFITATIASLGVQSAWAADYRAPYMPPPLEAIAPLAPPPAEKKTFDWRRCYAGAQAGMKIVDNSMSFAVTEFYRAVQINKTSDTLPGPVVGAQLGCNHVFNGGLLAGFEFETLWGPKNQIDCAAQVDPVAQCIELKKRIEAFASLRLGYVVDNSFLCDCLNGLMLYARAGIGYTRTDVKMNVNTVAYRVIPDEIPQGADYPASYVPQFAQNYNLTGSRSLIGPLIGFGVERAIAENWTFRADMSAMVSPRRNVGMRVVDGTYYGATEEARQPGGRLPFDPSRIDRNPRVGDVLPSKIQEIETRFTFGVNRLF